MIRILYRFPVFLLLGSLGIASSGCALVATRPLQEMSNTQSAIRAAEEVQADVLAPELYRQATEWFYKAKAEYRFKDFYKAKQFADKARVLAEQAELLAIRNGGIRGGDEGEAPELKAESMPPPPPADAPNSEAKEQEPPPAPLNQNPPSP